MFFGWKSKPEESTPFRAVVRPETPETPSAADRVPEVNPAGEEDGWSVEDIEAAYIRALEVAESVDAPHPPEELDDPDAGILTATTEETRAEAFPSVDAESVDQGLNVSHVETSSAADDLPITAPADEPRRVTPRQIIEALLFVGGRPLTSRQLADVLGGSHTPEIVDDTVNELNSEYSRQSRPYEVRLGEGGYRLDLKSEYEKVRARVFGIGPREVKLAQNALEVLALVAYQQPVSKAEVEDSGIKGANGLLRQLLRRELISLQRLGDGEPDTYRTTDRFLELFGLRSLNDLPRPEAVNLR